MNNEIKYAVGFNLIPGIGRVKIAQLEKYFGSLENAWGAEPGELKKAGMESHVIRAIAQWQPKILLDAEMEKLERIGVAALTYHDEKYPARLREIYDYPPLIYLRGEIFPEKEWYVAVVGTRHASLYGRQVTEELVTALAKNNITVVSGLAKGIDTVAHNAALAAGGRSIAIFACGVDIVYPAENTNLARRLMEQGALISEYGLGIRPRADNFPRRNRIMSGMSLGVLVIEAGETSGAMITARMANEQNREVFAVPGSILSPTSRGTNSLIQEGAKLVRSYTDILEELNLTAVARQIEMKELLPSSEPESILLKGLGAEPVHIDELCRTSGLPTSTVSSTLAMMELKGLVKQVGLMNYALSREIREEYRVKIE